MKLTKLVAMFAAAGGLVAIASMPASAQHHGGHGHKGYAGSNHSGYTGRHSNSHHSGYDKRGHYSNPYNHGNKHHGSKPYSHYKYGDKNHGYKNYSYKSHGYKSYGHNSYPSYKYGHHNKPSYGHNNYRPRYSWDPRQRVVWNPYFKQRHSHYKPRYYVGSQLSLSRYPRIYNYSNYGLYHPPQGYHWVRSDNDAYLTAAGTGLIAGIIIGAIANN